MRKIAVYFSWIILLPGIVYFLSLEKNTVVIGLVAVIPSQVIATMKIVKKGNEGKRVDKQRVIFIFANYVGLLSLVFFLMDLFLQPMGWMKYLVLCLMLISNILYALYFNCRLKSL